MTRSPIPQALSVLACALLALAALGSPSLAAQTEADAGATSLHVRSAELNPATNTIAVELANETGNAVTAYGLDITVTSAGKTLAHTEYGADLLNLILNGRGKRGAEASWAGAIEPGAAHTDSIPANIPAGTEATGPIEVHVVVMVALWSDGAVEGTNHFMIRQMQDGRLATLHAEEKVLALLSAPGADGDAQTRIGAALTGLSALIKAPAQDADTPASEMLNSGVLDDAVANLTRIKSSANAGAELRTYAADLAAAHQRRVALLLSMGEA
jgi:hypothetical protein